MTSIVSMPDATYADSMHVLKIKSADDSIIRRPKIKVINQYAAYAISGVAIFPEAVEKAIEVELARLANIVLTVGYINDNDMGQLKKFVQDEAHILLILAESRWVIELDTIVFIPPFNDLVIGSGSNHYNSLRYLKDSMEPEKLITHIVLLDELSRGPWVRFKHSQLKATLEEN